MSKYHQCYFNANKSIIKQHYIWRMLELKGSILVLLLENLMKGNKFTMSNSSMLLDTVMWVLA